VSRTMPVTAPASNRADQPTDDERRVVTRLAHYDDQDSGYFKQQSTRPQRAMDWWIRRRPTVLDHREIQKLDGL